MKFPAYIAAIICGIAMIACVKMGEETMFVDLPTQGWAYTDTLIFNPAPARGELYVDVRHDAVYPYSNLWLEVAVDGLNGRMRTDTVNVTLCDPYGQWLGKGFGGSFQMELPVASQVAVDSATTLRVRHIMRCDTIVGIDQIGIRIIPAS